MSITHRAKQARRCEACAASETRIKTLSRKCLICFVSIAHRSWQAKYCEECAAINRRARDSERNKAKWRSDPELRAKHIAKSSAANATPEGRAARARRRKERIASDPKFRKQLADKNAKQRERRRTDPALRERELEYGRRKAAERRARLPEEEKEAVRAKKRSLKYRNTREARRRLRYHTDPAYRESVVIRQHKRRDLRRRLYTLAVRQGGICPLCNDPLPEKPADAHVDHIVRIREGGTDDLDNLRAVHAGCNLARK